MELGFITPGLGQIIRDKCVVLARVRHSQRVNDPRVQLSNETKALQSTFPLRKDIEDITR